MKQPFLTIILLSIVICSYGQGKKAEADKKAIEKLIYAEVNSFLVRDWEKFENCWLHEPYSKHFITSMNSFNSMIGWENIKNLLYKGFEAEGSRNYFIEKTDLDIHVFGEAAYATYSEKYTVSEADSTRIVTGINNSFFAKKNGDWKYVCLNLVNNSSFENARMNRIFIQEYHEALSGKAKTTELAKKYIAESDQELIYHIIMLENSFPVIHG